MSKPVKNNSQLLYTQAIQLFEEAQAKFENGTIKSEPLLISNVFNAFQSFFTSMGKPNMVPRYAPEQGPPWSEDYNSMMTEVRKDLELLFQEVEILGRSLYTDFNHNMVQHEIITKQYEEVLDKMRDLETYAGINGSGVSFGRDDFLNKNKIDYARIAGTPLEIVDGAVTLPQTNRVNVATTAKVTIITGNRKENQFVLGTESNGFPGNNTEIHSVTDDVLTNKNYIPTFLGEENNHSNFGAVLDGSPNTWFEYEKVNVREQDKVRVAKNLGWDYEVHQTQTVKWAEDPDNGILKLHMQLILDKETIINQINCNMYTPANYTAKTAIVKNILVSDGKGSPVSVMPKSKSPDQTSFHFPPVKAKVIDVIFEQPEKYITDIGHIFYEKKVQTQDQSDYAMDAATKKYKYAPRVEGPLISLEDLGLDVQVSASSVEANYPLLSAKEIGDNSIGQTINRMSANVDMSTVDMGVEKFEGFRWCIGVRDIEVYSCEFADEGELVTYPFYFDKPLDKISLTVSEDIPSAFVSNKALQYEWIKYFISIDDGGKWYPITPMSQQVVSDEQPPKIYTIRTVEESGGQIENKPNYLESEYPVYSMRMKIVAKRPEDYSTQGFMLKDSASTPVSSFVQHSPIISSYMFNILSQSEVIVDEDHNPYETVINDKKEDKPNPSIPPVVVPPPVDPPPTVDPLVVTITNQKAEWCVDEDLKIRGSITSPNQLTKVELYNGSTLMETKTISGNVATFEFVIPKALLSISTATFVVKAYDSKRNATTMDVMNIIDCTGLPPEDRPHDRDTSILNVVIDKYPIDLCECAPLVFYGSVQGPNPIQATVFSVNGLVVDPNNLGTPPSGDPCGNNIDLSGGASIASIISDEELLEIKDFGEWLDAFEEREDCGCKNKQKNVAAFEVQSAPFVAMDTTTEQSFYVEIPYWKLRQLGVQLDKPFVVEVRAIDTANKEAKANFTVTAKSCEAPPTKCWNLESITVYYLNQRTMLIENKNVPANAMPYSGINNGVGTSVTVGWRDRLNAPIIMVTDGYDDSGYAFQLHAVALHYYDENDVIQTTWTESIIEKDGVVLNETKMLGNNTKPTDWLTSITTNGNYSDAPTLGTMNDYVTLGFSNDWMTRSCPVTLADYSPIDNLKPETPPDGVAPINSCDLITGVIFQVYDDVTKSLQTYKAQIKAGVSSEFTLGGVVAQVGYSSYFSGPVIKVKTGTGSQNILLTAMGIVYKDIYDRSMTAWSTGIRYTTSGVQNEKFAVGSKKALDELTWVSGGVVDYSAATFVGAQGDMVAFTLDTDVTTNLCAIDKDIDSEIGIDPLTPPDVPVIELTQVVSELYLIDPASTLIFTVKDNVGLRSVDHSLAENGTIISEDRPEMYDTPTEYVVTYTIDPATQTAGDAIDIHIKATNVYGATAEITYTVLIASTHSYDYKVELKWGYTGDGTPSDLDLQAYDVTNGAQVDRNNKTYTAPDGSRIWMDADYSTGHDTSDDIANEIEVITFKGYVGKSIAIGIVDVNGKFASLLTDGTFITKAFIVVSNSAGNQVTGMQIQDDHLNVNGPSGHPELYVGDINIPIGRAMDASDFIPRYIKGRTH